MKLIYHNPQNTNATHIFEDTLSEIIVKNNIKIVSPYLNIDYLSKKLANIENWKLITDINELIFLNSPK